MNGPATRAALATEFGYGAPDNSAFRKQLYVLTGNHLVEADGGDVRAVRLLVDGFRQPLRIR